MNLGVVGTGYVGLVTAVCFAELGHHVVAIDTNAEIIARLSLGRATIYEPGLEELLTRNLARGGLRFTTNPEDAIRDADIVFLCVGTPSRSDGAADCVHVEDAARIVAPLLNGYKLIVEKSTVPLNTAYRISRTIRGFAGGPVNIDVASNPEFLREGSAIHDFLHPDRVIVGVDSDRARALLLDLYRDFDCPILVTDVPTAELIKHAANSFLATKISYINMVSELCEAVGVDIKTVAKGIGLDPRIGEGFLQAGLGFGGACLPKDVKAFMKIADEHGVDFGLLKEVEQINRRRVDLLLRKIERALWVIRGKVVAVLGAAFKPGTDDIRGAPALAVIPKLRKNGAVVRVYDPKASANMARALLPDQGLSYPDSPYDTVRDAHALVILTAWDEFRELDLDRISALMKTPIIVDGRNLFDPTEMRDRGFEYYTLGRGDVALPLRAALEVQGAR